MADRVEEEIKYKVYFEYFNRCKYHPGWNKIDVCLEYRGEHILWAEAKNRPTDIDKMFAQLIFTIYKVQKIYEAPEYLAVFDSEKIAFIKFDSVAMLFNELKNADFDWTVRPSNYNTKEFKKIQSIIKDAIVTKDVLYELETLYNLKQLVFYFNKDKKELKEWINNNITTGTLKGPKKINADNFYKVYNSWLDNVKPYINMDWDAIKRDWNTIDCDFFLADLFAEDNYTIDEKLYVLLQNNKYSIQKEAQGRQYGIIPKLEVIFKDNQAAHKQFWNRYERPPEEEYWDLIIKRRDLLVPNDIRERLGAFFTPSKWVSLAQQYMTDVWGDLSNYYIWDCAGGTGNLLQGFTNSDNLYISDINIENIYITQGRIEKGEINLLHQHCFQFDFLNDDFDKLPKDLREIINDEKKRKNLIIFINPPYAEASTPRSITGTGINRTGISNTKMVYKECSEEIGKYPLKELYIQFWVRVYKDIPNCKLASFATLKHFSSEKFINFRKWFLAKFMKGYLFPANSFDNVDGLFLIGFQCWDTAIKKQIKNSKFDLYELKIDKHKRTEVKRIGKKKIFTYNGDGLIIDWLRKYYDKNNPDFIGYLNMLGTDFQSNKQIFITNNLSANSIKKILYTPITKNNIIPICIYFAVRKMISTNWINNNDRYFYPNDNLNKDIEFQNDCFVYTLFHGKNLINCIYGTNHWIPFTEKELDIKETFESHFMTDFMKGKIKIEHGNGMFTERTKYEFPLQFSTEAIIVFDCGHKLWHYYHRTFGNNGLLEYNVNASLYDIRRSFQGEKNGRMKSKSSDDIYNKLIVDLRAALKKLGEKNEQKIYEYGFLLQ